MRKKEREQVDPGSSNYLVSDEHTSMEMLDPIKYLGLPRDVREDTHTHTIYSLFCAAFANITILNLAILGHFTDCTVARCIQYGRHSIVDDVTSVLNRQNNSSIRYVDKPAINIAKHTESLCFRFVIIFIYK